MDSFSKFLKTPTGFAGINDVNDVNTSKIDDTESFWFAEVLKYLCVFFPLLYIMFNDRGIRIFRYLTFDDPNHISLDNCAYISIPNPYFHQRISNTMCNSIVVFNTECHPFKAPPAKDVYGTATGGIKSPTSPFSLQQGAPLPAISPNAKLPQAIKVPSQ